MVEMLTVVDINRNQLGVKSREEVHRDGDWHETFQCWFIEQVENTYYIYVQKRSANKKDYPSMYDITAAGHLLVDETVEDGVREIKEELGIDVSLDELTFLQAIPNSITLPNLIDNEISLVYLYEVKKPIRFSFLDEEVEAVMRVKLSDFEKLVFGEVDQVFCQNHEDGEINGCCITISKSQMVPHEMKYFKKVMNKINEYVNNKDRCV
mgnify:FL=1